MRTINNWILLGGVCLATASCALPGDSNESDVAPTDAQATQRAPLRGLGGRALGNEAAVHPAATASLATLRTLAQGRTASRRFFSSADEVDRAVLSDGLPMYMIGLLPLRAFRRGDDPVSLLIDERSVLFPITVDAAVRTGAVMRRDPASGTWAPVAFGKVALTKAAASAREQVRSQHPQGEHHSLVEVPALHARFIGHDEAGVLYLTPLSDVAAAGVTAGQTEEAGVLLEKFVPMAVALDEHLLN